MDLLRQQFSFFFFFFPAKNYLQSNYYKKTKGARARQTLLIDVSHDIFHMALSVKILFLCSPLLIYSRGLHKYLRELLS